MDVLFGLFNKEIGAHKDNTYSFIGEETNLVFPFLSASSVRCLSKKVCF